MVWRGASGESKHHGRNHVVHQFIYHGYCGCRGVALRTLACPKCQAKLQAPPAFSGKRYKCARCGSINTIPEVPAGDNNAGGLSQPGDKHVDTAGVKSVHSEVSTARKAKAGPESTVHPRRDVSPRDRPGGSSRVPATGRRGTGTHGSASSPSGSKTDELRKNASGTEYAALQQALGAAGKRAQAFLLGVSAVPHPSCMLHIQASGTHAM